MKKFRKIKSSDPEASRYTFTPAGTRCSLQYCQYCGGIMIFHDEYLTGIDPIGIYCIQNDICIDCYELTAPNPGASNSEE